LGRPGSRCSPSLGYGARYSLGPLRGLAFGHASAALAQRRLIRGGRRFQKRLYGSGSVWLSATSHLRSKWLARYKSTLSIFVFAMQNHIAHTGLAQLALRSDSKCKGKIKDLFIAFFLAYMILIIKPRHVLGVILRQ
jgi:hypothetical protein